MKHYLTLVITILALTACGKDDAKASKSNSKAVSAESFIGTYRGQCLELGTAFYVATAIVFEPGAVMKIQNNQYDDIGCVKLSSQQETTYEIAEESAVEEGLAVSVVQKSMTMTYLKGRHLEYARELEHFGVSDWEPEVPVSIAGKRYSGHTNAAERLNGTKDEWTFSLKDDALFWFDAESLLDKQ
jgi:hypothetical protein